MPPKVKITKEMIIDAAFEMDVFSNRAQKKEDRNMNSLREWEEAFEQAVDVKKSYDLAKRMEGPKTNPVLGYRTAGSKAEWETGELLLKEMQD